MDGCQSEHLSTAGRLEIKIAALQRPPAMPGAAHLSFYMFVKKALPFNLAHSLPFGHGRVLRPWPVQDLGLLGWQFVA